MAARKAVTKEVEDTSGEQSLEAVPASFTWKPKDGGADIVLPHASTAVPKGKALGFFYQMNKRQGNLVAQVTYALKSACVPESMQDRVFSLDDDEVTELVAAWAEALTGASPGES